MDVGMEDEEWVMVGRPRIPLEPMEGGADQSGQDDEPLKVVFAAPAKHWTDAAPIGNGRLGAMIWGGVASEKIRLNGTHYSTSCLPQPNCFMYICDKKMAFDDVRGWSS